MSTIEEVFANYLEGKCTEEELSAFFATHPGAKQEFEELKQLFSELPEGELPDVSAAADNRFYAFVQKETKPPGISVAWNTIFRYAAISLAVVAAYALGRFGERKEVVSIEKPVYITRVDTLRVIQEVVPTQQARAESKTQVMDQLASIKKEVSQINDVQHKMVLAMLRQETAAARLEAIQYSYGLEDSGGILTEALFRTLESDPSVSVRLAALEALGRYELSPDKREQLVLALAEQHDPAMQLGLISTLAELREVSALPVFAEMVKDPLVSQDIRNKAEMAIKIINM